jgi:polysaccharide pyruvyl transferase WcaK-like protein
MAFLLDPAPSDRIEAILEKARLETGNKPLIGTSPRWFIWRNRSEQCYIQLVAEMIDFLIEKLNAQVCLIPHSQEILYAKGIPSDNEVNQKIKSLVKNKQALFLIPDTIDPMEAKGIILRCDLFISWKLHTTIAAVSSGKPTCCIYYGDKMKSIFGEMMGQREYQIDIRSHSPEQLLNEIKLKCQKLWSHRAEVTKELVTRTRVVKELTISHSELIRTIIKNSSSKQ